MVSYHKNRKVIINVTQEIINVEKGSGKFPGGPGAWKIQNSRSYRKRKNEEADTKFLFGEERASGKQAPNLRSFQPPSTPPQLSTTTRVILLREEILHQLTWSFICISLFARLEKTSQVVLIAGFLNHQQHVFHLHVFVLNPFLSKTCKDRCHLRGFFWLRQPWKGRVPNPYRDSKLQLVCICNIQIKGVYIYRYVYLCLTYFIYI